MNVMDIISPTQLAELNAGAAGMGETEAQEITTRIRDWVRAYPTADIARAYQGRIWIAMGYESWQEWCDCELDGFKLPSRVERQEVVEEMRWDHGMSGAAIADAIGVSEMTVSRDISSLTNVRDEPPPPALGKDGRVRDSSNTGRKPLPSNMPASFDCEGKGDDGYEALLGTVKRTLNGLAVSPTIEQAEATLQLLDRYTRKFTKIKENLR